MKNNGIVDEIFSEIKKEIENDLSYFENSKEKFRVAVCDILIKEKIYRNPDLDRDTLIKRINIPKDLFAKRFQSCFNMPFGKLINSLRLKESVILIEQSDLLIEEIAEKVGFGTIRTFQRQFMENYGMSPNNYRKTKHKPI